MIRVLIVDDSALVRQSLAEIINSSPQMQVIGTAADPYSAVEQIKKQKPDVITLDVEMPKMDGITFLRKIMSQNPIPVVICSTFTEHGTATQLQALESGAVDIITKPKNTSRAFFEESKTQILDAIKAASQARLKKMLFSRSLGSPTKKLTADAVIDANFSAKALAKTTDKIVVIGASTGGTEAIRVVLQAMPRSCPPIVVVQHMPENFTKSFAQRLNGLCQINVKEAENNDSCIPGHALIAPGNYHTLLKRSGAKYYVEVKDGPLVSRHRPSVDVLFRSAAKYAGANAIGVIMTGMGDDGASGLLEMRNMGAFTIGQDEETCVVYGMPREAHERGAVMKQTSLQHVAQAIIKAAL